MDKNAILAAVLSIGVLVAWDYFYIRPIQKKNAAKSQARAEKEKAAKAKKRFFKGKISGIKSETPYQLISV